MTRPADAERRAGRQRCRVSAYARTGARQLTSRHGEWRPKRFLSREQEAELAVLVAEVNKAVPRMIEQLDAMSATLQATHEHVDRTLRAAGIRK